MQSRAILILSAFGLACVIVAGSMAIRLTSASASTSASDVAEEEPYEDAEQYRDAPPTASVDGVLLLDEPTDFDRSTAAPADLSPRDAAAADTLEKLLRRVHMHFEPEGAGVSTAMIPHLAEMISVINQHEHLVYRIAIVDPDPALAERRVETLKDVLRLNVRVPAGVQIEGRQGYREALIEVSES